MRGFLKESVLFLLPLLFVAIPCVITLAYSGELYDKDAIKPLRKDQLIGLAYTELNDQYKFAMSERLSALDVMALGSSRIMQIKREIINDNLSFYNAGGAINDYRQYRFFLSKLHYSPKLLIINIDQFYFNPEYRKRNNKNDTFDKSCYEYHRDNIAILCGNFISDFCKGKIELKKVFDNEKDNIGLNARINNNGFADDGSYHYGQLIERPASGPDFNFKDTYERIETGTRRFEYGETADRIVACEIDSLLSECSRRNISVLAILPPFAPLVLQKMEETGKYHYMQQIYKMLSPYFAKYDNCYLYDFTDMRSMDVHNYDFVDGFHGSELIYDTILETILNENESLRKYFIDKKAFDETKRRYESQHIRFHNFI